MATLLGADLVPASVPAGATFLDAAVALTSHPVSAVAVLGPDGEVVGVFGAEELLRGLFPRYLAELRHTAFAQDDPALLARCAEQAGSQPVERHMKQPVTVDDDASATHVAERFLHCELDALPVVRDGRFVGMLGRSEFCRAVLEAASERV